MAVEELPPPLGTPDNVQDLRVPPLPDEHPAEYIVRVRATEIDSQSPGDLVPNTAHIRRGV
ncbi:MAG TPA: hypothetical protein VGJ60_20545 [Chloroflexota bacterium]|jgi:hypothetical protein